MKMHCLCVYFSQNGYSMWLFFVYSTVVPNKELERYPGKALATALAACGRAEGVWAKQSYTPCKIAHHAHS